MVHPQKCKKKKIKCKYQYYMQYTHSYAQICTVIVLNLIYLIFVFRIYSVLNHYNG